MEQVIPTRINRFVEDEGLYPDTFIVFRSHLSACMLQLKGKVIDNKTMDTRIVVGLDVYKAFDYLKRSTILESLGALNVGAKS